MQNIVKLLLALVTIHDSLGNFLSQNNIMSGIMFPEEIVVKEGSDINLKLVNPFEAPQLCKYRTPKSNVAHEIGNDPRITAWQSELCGILIKNVSVADEGFWALSSIRNNDYIRGVLMVTVVLKNDTEAMMNSTDYCVVSRPDQLSVPQIGTCVIPEDSPGEWTLRKGVTGQNMEIVEEVYHEVPVEKVTTSIDKVGTRTISLLCKLENSDRQIKVCRFLRLEDNYALNVDNGLGSDRYRFHGMGLADGECGITIDNPKDEDKGLWKCFITTLNMENEEKSFGHILDAGDSATSLRLTYPGRQAIINGSEASITCNANLGIDYCWFRKPNGKILSVTDKMMKMKGDDVQDFWYYGLGLGLGDCGITLKEVNAEDGGQWRCSAGTAKAGFEAQQTFQVDVRTTVPNIVAELPSIDVSQGDSYKIECRTVMNHLPIEQCHFVTPSGTGFSIDESITSDNSLGAYYFNPNRAMRSGWCSLVVKRARKDHTGTWQCLARSPSWDVEGMDMIEVKVKGGISVAGGIGGAVIALILIAVLTVLGVYVMQRRKRNRILAQRRQYEEERRTSRTSGDSNNSGIELEEVSQN